MSAFQPARVSTPGVNGVHGGRPRDASGARAGRIHPLVWRPRVVGIKNWFGGGAKQDPGQKPGQKPAKKDENLTIDDLIVLERYDEAVEHLKSKIKLNPNDLHMHLKL